MFDEIADKFEAAWKKLRGQDKISDSNIQGAIREVRRALLEADVNLQVVKEFVEEISKQAQGADVIAGVRPDQQFIKIVYDELVRTMGEANVPLAEATNAPTVILMAGLQGTGKTTATAKLALHLRKLERTALLVATDVYRPAAIDQLITLGKQINVPVFEMGADADPVGFGHPSGSFGKRPAAQATFDPDRSGQAFSFDGVDDYVQIGTSTSFQMTNAFTVDAWVNPTGAGTQWTGVAVIAGREGEYLFGRNTTTGRLNWVIANSANNWSAGNVWKCWLRILSQALSNIRRSRENCKLCRIFF